MLQHVWALKVCWVTDPLGKTMHDSTGWNDQNKQIHKDSGGGGWWVVTVSNENVLESEDGDGCTVL